MVENAFDEKTDKNSSELYFHYYAQLQHQQNMLQDYVRTGAYYEAITENSRDFQGSTVMDVGAGSGILSLFAAQAGAKTVYAVEASNMAKYAQILADTNPGVGGRVKVCNSKIEELEMDERVDILVSEPMGTLLVNERMLETYIYARDHFLKPGGRMFPQVGRIHAALFSDDLLHAEMNNKSAFWMNTSYFGVDVHHLFSHSVQGYFSQVVVDAFDPAVLASLSTCKNFDFGTIKEEELHDIKIPINLQAERQCDIHGLALWFDVLFKGSTSQRWLSTAPGLPTTHWFQLRCVLRQPLAVNAGDQVTGLLHLVAHERQSYDIYLNLTAPPLQSGFPSQQASGKLDLKEPFYRQLTEPYRAAPTAAAAPASPFPSQTQDASNVLPVGDLEAGGGALPSDSMQT